LRQNNISFGNLLERKCGGKCPPKKKESVDYPFVQKTKDRKKERK
jgi:hypothetical protein